MYRPGMRVLVLGGEGFIGSHLVDRIPGAVPLDDRSLPKHRFPSTIVKDICGPIDDEVRAADLVIHAACRDIRHSMTEPLEDARVNVLGTLNVLLACRRHRVPFFYLSSVSVHREVSHYAVSKAAGERYCRMYRQWIPTSMVRLSNVFGPRDTESVVARWLRADEIGLIDPDATRDFTYVKDTIDGILRALEVWPEEEVEIGTGREVRLGDLAEWIARRRGVPIRRIGRREIDNVVRRVVDADVAARRIGFRARWTVFEGLEEMLAAPAVAG